MCNYNFDILKWSDKAITNIFSLDIGKSIEKDLAIGSNIPTTYVAVISKFLQVNLLVVFTLVDKIKKVTLIKKSVQDVEIIGW